jgi:ABC-type branched-subunit amino acid transport system ATPase component
VIVMAQGKIIAKGSAHDVFDEPAVRAAYFATPAAA